MTLFSAGALRYLRKAAMHGAGGAAGTGSRPSKPLDRPIRCRFAAALSDHPSADSLGVKAVAIYFAGIDN